MKKITVTNPNAQQQPRRSFLDDIANGNTTLRPAVERAVSPRAEGAIQTQSAKASVTKEFQDAIKSKRAGQDEDHTETSTIANELTDFTVSEPTRRRKSLNLGSTSTTPSPTQQATQMVPFSLAAVFERRISETKLPSAKVSADSDEEDNFPEIEPVLQTANLSSFGTKPTAGAKVAPTTAIKAPVVVKPATVAAAKPAPVVNLDGIEAKQRRLSAALFASINVAPADEDEAAPVVAKPAPVVAKPAPVVQFDAKAIEEANRKEAARLQAIEEKNARVALLARQEARKQQEEADAKLAQQLQAEEQNTQRAREQQLAKVRQEQLVQAEKAKAQQKQLDEAAKQVEVARAAQVAQAVRTQMLDDLYNAAVNAGYNSHSTGATNAMGRIIIALIQNGGEIEHMRAAIENGLRQVFNDGNPSTTSFRGFMMHHFNSTTTPEAVEFRRRVADDIIANGMENREMANLFEEGNLVKRNAGRTLRM